MFPSDACFLDPIKANAMTLAIKRWVYTWMNDSSCGTPKQYEFLKELLLHVLETNAEAVGWYHTADGQIWLRQQRRRNLCHLHAP
jgi:hypothetical protein